MGRYTTQTAEQTTQAMGLRISRKPAIEHSRHEGEIGCYWYWRAPTPEEAAELEQREAAERVAADARNQRKQTIERIRNHIRSTGERPEGMNLPEGRRVLDTQNIGGGGDWFVVGTDWIWYCQNNGADGDNWSENNVRTGGAGAIGWRIPYSAELAQQIEEL